jgi:hypothetical protein
MCFEIEDVFLECDLQESCSVDLSLTRLVTRIDVPANDVWKEVASIVMLLLPKRMMPLAIEEEIKSPLLWGCTGGGVAVEMKRTFSMGKKRSLMAVLHLLVLISLLALPFVASNCPNLCHGHGACYRDTCICEDFYNLVPDCSLGKSSYLSTSEKRS